VFWSSPTGCANLRKRLEELRIGDGIGGWRVPLAARFTRQRLFGRNVESDRFLESRFSAVGAV
jgi:hypothetical protein